jgi:hypothetical protein
MAITAKQVRITDRCCHMLRRRFSPPAASQSGKVIDPVRCSGPSHRVHGAGVAAGAGTDLALHGLNDGPCCASLSWTVPRSRRAECPAFAVAGFVVFPV